MWGYYVWLVSFFKTHNGYIITLGFIFKDNRWLSLKNCLVVGKTRRVLLATKLLFVIH